MGTQETNPNSTLAARALRGARWWFCGLLLASSIQAQVPEPETIFYGRIINRTSGQEYQLTGGTLSWTVQGGSSSAVSVTTQIGSVNDGKFSYVVKLPHQAKSSGLVLDAGVLPLHTGDASFENSVILVNGAPARPVSPGDAGFIASQPRRGGSHRLDLEVFDSLEDSDGDGLPDWWENLHGLDKLWAGDALLRRGSNRFTYLEAFRLGLDPSLDDRLPELLTKQITVAAQGATGLLLRAVDSLSQPAQIRYRLVAAPAGGSVVLRNARPDPKLADRTLAAGDSFTQADIDAGRVEFLHKDAGVDSTVLALAIRNSNPAVAEIEREVAVEVFRPDSVAGRAAESLAAGAPSAKKAPAGDLWRNRASDAFVAQFVGAAGRRNRVGAVLLSAQLDYTFWDGTAELPARDLKVPSAGLSGRDYAAEYRRRFGRARNHVILAGKGQITIEGGMADDVLVAGDGHTTAKGNAGRDIFVAAKGIFEIADFRPADGDMLDLSELIAGAPGPLAEKVTVTTGADTQLRITTGAEADAIALLKGLKLTLADLEKLRARGNVFTGSDPTAPAGNRLPVAVADEGYVSGDDSVVLSVLANDHDPDGDVVVLTGVSTPAAGLAVINGNTILYTPGPTFAGEDSFSYTISDGRGGWASAVVSMSYPYPAAAGTYLPLVLDAEGNPAGELRLQLGPTGSFSVSLRAAGVVFSGKGKFDGSGSAEVELKSRGRVLTLQLTIDLADPSYPIEGSISGPAVSYTVVADVALAKRASSGAPPQRYTMALHAPAGDVAIAGHGCATLAVAPSQRARITGVVADGTRFSAGTTLRSDGSARWTARLYGGGGWLTGTLQPGSSTAGTTRWIKSPSSVGATDGFDRALPTASSSYHGPSVASVHALDFTDPLVAIALVQMQGGFLGAVELHATLVFGRADSIIAQPMGAFTLGLKLNRATGLLTGTIEVNGAARAARAVVLQNQNRAFGHIADAASSSVEIVPQ